jgi:hypothetical protein
VDWEATADADPIWSTFTSLVCPTVKTRNRPGARKTSLKLSLEDKMILL